MDGASLNADSHLSNKLKWLTLFRILFVIILLVSIVVVQVGQSPSPPASPLLMVYGITAAIFVISIAYAFILGRMKQTAIFACIQLAVDTLIASFMVFMTGGFPSPLTFLYLLVIVYSSMILFRKGSLIVAALCSIEYAVIACGQYYGWLHPFGFSEAMSTPGAHVLYNVVMIAAACFSVAFLSSMLAEQEKRARNELVSLEDHLKRVEKLAAVGEMASGLAHEIKNPLASLTGSIQLMYEELPCHPDHEKLMQIVLREADRLSALVTNFLLFARPPAGKPKEVHLSAAMDEILDLFENDAAGLRQITIARELDSGIWVRMDPMHLHQVVWNLSLNAAEAVDGPGVVTVRLYSVKPDKACIEIQDAGAGIAPEILPSIFDPFFTTKPRGTGLGLSIVHSILESYDSRLTVQSGPEEGTTVRFLLPRIAPPT